MMAIVAPPCIRSFQKLRALVSPERRQQLVEQLALVRINRDLRRRLKEVA